MPKSKENPEQQPQEPLLETTKKLSPEEEAMIKVFTEWSGIEDDLKAAPADQKELSKEEDTRLAHKWYFDSSRAGHTPEEYKALKQETSNALALDFKRYVKDADYKDLMELHNPLFAKILEDERHSADYAFIMKMYETRGKLGISDDQFKKVLELCDPDVQKSFNDSVFVDKLLRGAFKKLTPEASTRLDNAINRKMRRGIEQRESVRRKDDEEA